jgi:hypothetical protein
MAAARLRAPAAPFSLLDPCAGEGRAVAQLAGLLGCRPDHVFAVELEQGRAETLRTNLPDAKVLAPASVFGCGASFGSFGLLWLNSPFDAHFGGGRTEDHWLKHLTPWLAPGGVLALVCPEDVVECEYRGVPEYLRQWYTNVSITPFPAEVRQYKEVVVLAVKRDKPYEAPNREGSPYFGGYGYGSNLAKWESIQAPEGFVYDLPPSAPPRVFAKREPTEPELQRALLASPLRQRWVANPAAAGRAPSPPLALGTGHVALLLASGYLDGVVTPPGEKPHLVRGTSRKKKYVAKVETTESEDGKSTTTKTVYAEKIELVVRVADLTGKLTTFSNGGGDEAPAGANGKGVGDDAA